MASLIFSHAKTIRNKCKKEAKHMAEIDSNTGINYNESYNKWYNKYVKNEISEFINILNISKELHEVYNNIVGLTTKNWYFITIRPDEKKIDFENFYKLVCEYLNRSFFLEYKMSFEQKGCSEENLGKGFHCHIVANTKHRSKGECLRDTQSSFARCCLPNCIEIDTTRNPDSIVNNYLIEYKSSDGHKESTKEWDSLWRKRNSLEDLYSNERSPRSLPVSSPVQVKTYTLVWD